MRYIAKHRVNLDTIRETRPSSWSVHSLPPLRGWRIIARIDRGASFLQVIVEDPDGTRCVLKRDRFGWSDLRSEYLLLEPGGGRVPVVGAELADVVQACGLPDHSPVNLARAFAHDCAVLAWWAPGEPDPAAPWHSARVLHNAFVRWADDIGAPRLDAETLLHFLRWNNTPPERLLLDAAAPWARRAARALLPAGGTWYCYSLDEILERWDSGDLYDAAQDARRGETDFALDFLVALAEQVGPIAARGKCPDRDAVNAALSAGVNFIFEDFPRDEGLSLTVREMFRTACGEARRQEAERLAAAGVIAPRDTNKSGGASHR